MEVVQNTQAPKDTAPKTMEELNKQFSQLCAEAGQLQFEIALKQNHLQQINAKINEVNGEAFKLRQATTEAPKAGA